MAIEPVAVAGRMIPAPRPAAPTASGTNLVYSYNWSGYAQSGPSGTFQSVVDTWTVPTVTSTSGDQYAADWVGIGGYSDSTLIQAGTSAQFVNGTPQYYAWTEVLPQAERQLTSLVIKPGDRIRTTVKFASGKWHMTVSDLTAGATAGRTLAYNSSESSVEAIHERPCVSGNCNSTSDLGALAATGPVTFDPGRYGTGSKPTSALLKAAPSSKVVALSMVADDGSTVIATASAGDVDGDGFTVADGRTVPSAPSS
ncbi:MAG: G1 family glutamic endopeptidase [Acidimicrobiales bacterium]